MANKTMNIGQSEANGIDAIINGSLQLNKLKAPTSDGGTSFGIGTENQVLKSNGSTVFWSDETGIPLKSKTFTYAATANDTNNGRLIFATIALNDTSDFYAPWQVHYTLKVVCPTDKTIQGFYNIKMGNAGGTTTYYNENNFYSGKYPIYYHNLYDPKNGYLSDGAMIGARVQSATSPTVSRTYEITVLEEIGCSVTFLENINTYGNLYNSTKWNYREYNATTNGLQEYSDADTITADQLTGARITVDSEMPLCHGCLFGYTRDNKAVPFSAYTSTYNTYTTSASPTRVYPTHGIDWTKGMYLIYHWTYRSASTTNTESPNTFRAGADLRHTDNAVANNSTSNTLGLRDINGPIFVRGVIKNDGLFYIRPIDVTYNNTTYKKFWTQDIPTSIEADSDGNQYVYWYIGRPYFNSSYSNALYQYNFEQENPMFWYDGNKFTLYNEISSGTTLPSYGIEGQVFLKII